jgi:hypothetical protein
MDGSAIGAATDRDPLGRFKDGNSEWFAKRRRIAERVHRLSLDYDPSPSQQMLFPIAAQALDDAEHARSAERRLRAANAARRILSMIPRRERPLPTMAEIMSGVK